ncbi:type IV secretion system DNA-binding domain-containing protein, partial [Yersinia enterocolitica]
REKFTIREWMKGQADKTKNGWLFITSNEQYHDALKPLISMWLAIAATSLLAMGENRHRRVWFFYDELPSLHKLPSLPRIIAEARKFGGCFVLGFQNYAQLEDIYGPKSAADLFDLLNTKFFFRSPSAEIARFVEKDLGEMWRLKFSEQTSFGHEQVRDGISFGKEEERVSIVSYSDVQSLNDLQCFVTFPGDYPVVKLTMKYEPMPKVADGVVLRDVQTTLDRTIEDELFKRHAEERRELNVLFTPPSSVVEMSEPVAESPSATVNSTTADTTAKQSGANDADVAVSTGSGGVEQEIGQEAVSETPPGISNEGEV